MIFMPGYGIFQTVIRHIHQQVKIASPHGFIDHALRFSRTEARIHGFHNVAVSHIAAECDIILMLMLPLHSPADQIAVDLLPDLFAAFQRDQSETPDRYCFKVSLVIWHE